MLFKKILCPIDFSDGARQAMELAAKLAVESKGEVILVYVWHPPYVASPEITYSDTMAAQLRTDSEAELERWRAELEKLGARCGGAKFAVGAPWDEIVEIAKLDPAIDLLVIGTHGRTGLKRALLGSVAEKVVRHATCPVLVVR